ncbi:hypothetical protein ACWGJ6_22980 [Streptomyces canus]
MSIFDPPEECPHCDDPQPSEQMDAHVATAHADLPPCTARIETEHRETYRCAFRAGHAKGLYGKWHASKSGEDETIVGSRYVWNDSALGATPHRDPEPRVVGLDHFKAMGALSHTTVATGDSSLTQPDGGTPWCCAGRSGHVAECPLCPEYGTSLTEPCPGHGGSDENQARLITAELHARRSHPAFEYATTTGPRKQWDDLDRPPAGESASPDCTWERNVDAGRPGQGWDRFDYTEESYWRRLKPVPERPITSTCAVLHTDAAGNTIPCPGYPHADGFHLVPDGTVEISDAEPDEGHPEPPSEDEMNESLPVQPDPRQPAYDAVYEYIRKLGGYLPPDVVHRNATIWRAVNAALGATPVGRCVSSHCVEGDHILPVEGEES